MRLQFDDLSLESSKRPGALKVEAGEYRGFSRLTIRDVPHERSIAV
jgi:hypothetical protein